MIGASAERGRHSGDEWGGRRGKRQQHGREGVNQKVLNLMERKGVLGKRIER